MEQQEQQQQLPEHFVEMLQIIESKTQFECPSCNEICRRLKVYKKTCKIQCGDCWLENQAEKSSKEDYVDLKTLVKEVNENSTRAIDYNSYNTFIQNLQQIGNQDGDQKVLEILEEKQQFLRDLVQQINNLIEKMEKQKITYGSIRHPHYYNVKTHEVLKNHFNQDQEVVQNLNDFRENLLQFLNKKENEDQDQPLTPKIVNEINNNKFIRANVIRNFDEEFKQSLELVKNAINDLEKIDVNNVKDEDLIKYQFDIFQCNLKRCKLRQDQIPVEEQKQQLEENSEGEDDEIEREFRIKYKNHEPKVKKIEEEGKIIYQGYRHIDITRTCLRQQIVCQENFKNGEGSQHFLKFKILEKNEGTLGFGLISPDRKAYIKHILYGDQRIRNTDIDMQCKVAPNSHDFDTENLDQVNDESEIMVEIDIENGIFQAYINGDENNRMVYAYPDIENIDEQNAHDINLEKENLKQKIKAGEWKLFFEFFNCDSKIEVLSFM